MGKTLRGAIAALLALSAASAGATVVDFGSAQYDTSAFALSGNSADASSAATPASALPLVSTATVVGANDFATGSAIAAAGLLVATSEADSFAGALGGSAGAQAHLVSTITGSGRLTLHFDFDSLDTLAGGPASGTLFVLLTNTLGTTTTTLLDRFFDVSADTTLEFFLPGATSVLDLVLFSSATTTGAGQSAQNFAQVAVTGTVPTPDTLPLVAGGLVAAFVVRRRSSSRSA